MRESALEPMMQQNAIIEPLSILLKISLKRQPNQNPSLFRYCGILRRRKNSHTIFDRMSTTRSETVKMPKSAE